jgi:hypothetical protein
MADEIRNGDSKVRVVRLLGHRDDAGAWEIRDSSNAVSSSFSGSQRVRALWPSHCSQIPRGNGMIPCTSNHAFGAARLSWTV